MTIDESKAVRYCGSPDPGSAPRRGTSCEVEKIGGCASNKTFFQIFQTLCHKSFQSKSSEA